MKNSKICENVDEKGKNSKNCENVDEKGKNPRKNNLPKLTQEEIET